MVSPRWRASTPQPAAPARPTSSHGWLGAYRPINSAAGREVKGPALLAARLGRAVPSRPMPLPSFGFGHRPSWESAAPEVSGAALEEPQPQPARARLARQGGDRHRRRHRPRPAHRARVRQARLPRRLLLREHARPGRERAGPAHRDRAHRHGRRRPRHAVRRARPGRRSTTSSLETKQRLGGVHFLINNAGIASDGALWRLSEEAWQRGARHQRHRRVQLHPRGGARCSAASTTARS